MNPFEHKQSSSSPMKYGARKTFQIGGKWIEKTTKTEILVCFSCSGKYIKTRKAQDVCIRCIGKVLEKKRV